MRRSGYSLTQNAKGVAWDSEMRLAAVAASKSRAIANAQMEALQQN